MQTIKAYSSVVPTQQATDAVINWFKTEFNDNFLNWMAHQSLIDDSKEFQKECISGITEAIQKSTSVEIEFDWDKMWGDYVAMDKDGTWNSFKTAPILGVQGNWHTARFGDWRAEAMNIPHPNYEQSCYKRPV